jgi:hypothetical protein
LAWELASRGIAGEGAEFSRFRPKYENLQGASFSAVEYKQLSLLSNKPDFKLRIPASRIS